MKLAPGGKLTSPSLDVEGTLGLPRALGVLYRWSRGGGGGAPRRLLPRLPRRLGVAAQVKKNKSKTLNQVFTSFIDSRVKKPGPCKLRVN